MADNPSISTPTNPTIFNKLMSILNISEGGASVVQTGSNVVLIIGALLALTGTIGAMWSQNVLSRYANTRVSQNELKTEEAKRDAAKANEGLAQSNERAALLERETATARLELEKIKERTAPRMITPAQELVILSKLEGLSPVHICFEIDTGSDDALAFTNSIGNVLAKAGYVTLPSCRPMTGNVSRDITVSPAEAPEAQRILSALLHAGVRANDIRSGSHLYLPGYTQQEPPDTITLTIGKRGEE